MAAPRPPVRVGAENPAPISIALEQSHTDPPPYQVPRGATAAEIAQVRFLGRTTLIERDVTVGVGLVAILQNNPRRVYWLLQNRGAGDCATSPTRDVTTANGFLLSATGGYQSMQVDEDGEAVAYDRYAIAATAGNTVRVFEVLRV